MDEKDIYDKVELTNCGNFYYINFGNIDVKINKNLKINKKYFSNFTNEYNFYYCYKILEFLSEFNV